MAPVSSEGLDWRSVTSRGPRARWVLARVRPRAGRPRGEADGSRPRILGRDKAGRGGDRARGLRLCPSRDRSRALRAAFDRPLELSDSRGGASLALGPFPGPRCGHVVRSSQHPAAPPGHLCRSRGCAGDEGGRAHPGSGPGQSHQIPSRKRAEYAEQKRLIPSRPKAPVLDPDLRALHGLE